MAKGMTKTALVRHMAEKLGITNKDAAASQLKTVYKKLDQVSAKGTLHKNTASRKKSRLAKRLAKAQTQA